MISIEDIKSALFRVDGALPGYIAQATQSSGALMNTNGAARVFGDDASGIAALLAGASGSLAQAGASIGELSAEIKGAISKISM